MDMILNEKINPVEANLKWAIAKKRKDIGGFNGWDKIKNLLTNGSEKIRVGIKPEGKVIARENTKIFSIDDEEIGLLQVELSVPVLMHLLQWDILNQNLLKNWNIDKT